MAAFETYIMFYNTKKRLLNLASLKRNAPNFHGFTKILNIFNFIIFYLGFRWLSGHSRKLILLYIFL